MPHTDDELDTLATLLHDLPIENDGMTVSELDGFVAGLLVCPEMIMPSEWLPVVWADNVVETFSGEEQLESTLNAVMDHYNVLPTIRPQSHGTFETADPWFP